MHLSTSLESKMANEMAWVTDRTEV
jgi:hypothetical protein